MDMETIALRPATQDDSQFAFDAKKAAVGEYVRETYGWDEQEQRRLHEKRFCPSAIRIIMSAGRSIGLVSIHQADDRVHLRKLFLLPEAQGKGVGSQVLAQVLDEARQARRPVALTVLKSNPRAKSFYERHGFALLEETETHYKMETVS